jgi:hypothetical protein
MGLSGDVISTLLYQVILRAPRSSDLDSPEKDPYNRISDDVTPPSSFKGCYRTLKVLDIGGNYLDATHLDAKTFFSIFDFLESIEELNIEKLKFESFDTFKEQFLREFVSNQDYKPYMNTMRKINFNFANPIFYDNFEMTEEEVLYSLKNIIKNFPNVTELKVDFMERFFKDYQNKSSIIKEYQQRGITLLLGFSNSMPLV